MNKNQFFRKAVFPSAIMCVSFSCVALPISSGSLNELPDRIISMAYIIRMDPEFLNQPGDLRIKKKFNEIARIIPTSKQGNLYFMNVLPYITHYCHVQLAHDYFCGSKQLVQTEFDGYLFVTSWIHKENKRYIILISSEFGPEHTTILRISEGHAEVLYDSFHSQNACKMMPPDWGKLDVVHFVKVLSPTTYEIIVGSHTSPHQSATFKLNANLSGCSLTLLSQQLR